MTQGRPFHDDVHLWTYQDKDFDGALSSSQWGPIATAYRVRLRQARRFALDDETTKTIAEMSLMARRMPLWVDLARLPFDKIWVEWNDVAKLDALREGGVAIKPEEERARIQGCLIERDRKNPKRWSSLLFVMVDGRATPMPIQTNFDPDGSVERPIWETGGSKSIVVRSYPDLFPGYANLALMGIGLTDEIEADALASEWHYGKAEASIEPTMEIVISKMLSRGGEEMKEKARTFLKGTLHNMTADLRFIITLLAVLNDVPLGMRAVEAPAGHMKARMRNVPYLDHHVVTINLPKRRQAIAASRMLTKAFSKLRAHEVRGHWRRVVLDAMGTPPSGKRPRKEVVLGEDGIARIWIDEHIRGDASIGWSQKRYEIKHGG